MIYLYWSKLPNEVDSELYYYQCSLLPKVLQQRIARYKTIEDRLARLIGKLLLRKAFMQTWSFDSSVLDRIQYTQYNRPYLDQKVDFNLSHSGMYVICAVSKTHKVGIDVQKVEPVSLPSFQETMTAEQWDYIYQSENTVLQFFKYWAMKEAVLKGDGRGIHFDLKNVQLQGLTAKTDCSTWFLSEVKLDGAYVSYMASRPTPDNVQLKFCQYSSLAP